MPQAIRDGIIVVLVISGPLVLAAAAIGLLIGILQAATQVQEQTIGSALKIIGVFAIIIFAGFWMYQYLNQYTSRTLSNAFTFVPKQKQKVIPRDLPEDVDASFESELGRPDEPIKLLQPEKIEETFPDNVPVGAPLLGAPEPPKPPTITKFEPPKPPEIPKKPEDILPEGIQEFKPILPPAPPEVPPELPEEIAPEAAPQEIIQQPEEAPPEVESQEIIEQQINEPVENQEENPGWLE